MEEKTFKQLSSAEQVQELVALVTPLIEPMARLVTMLGGKTTPELVFDHMRSSGSTQLAGHGGEALRDLMLDLKESQEYGSRPVGWVFESVSGLERIPVQPGDQSQIDLLEKYLRSKNGDAEGEI